MRERADIVTAANAQWPMIMKGLDFDMEAIKSFYRELALDIKIQKQRIGGDWAVAHVVFSREIRDMMRLVFWDDLTKHISFFFRDILGPQLMFINLTMNDKDRNQRLLERHEGDEQVTELMKVDFCHLLQIRQIFSII